MIQSIHLDLDEAWPQHALDLRRLDAKMWGPQLRFTAPASAIESFYVEMEPQLPPFILYGSGDFHHLSALWLRRLTAPVVVVSFDNHPDWDIRPPKWCCGGWVNRALELPQIQKVSVWGCGNFECWWPGQAFGNRRAEREGRLDLHAWADDRPASKQKRRGAIFRATWREEFQRFAREVSGGDVYVTIDIDCLRRDDAITNWENGKFATDDVAWAVGELRRSARIVAGDICGAFSEPKYARLKQRFVSQLDHPKLPQTNASEARATNLATLARLWPVLTQ